MPILMMLKGLSASGKSTKALQLSQENGYKRINKDDLRRMIDDGVWSRSNEKTILQARDTLIEMYMKLGYNIVIDDTNLHPMHEKRFVRFVDEFNTSVDDAKEKYTFVVDDSFCDVSLKECIERDLKRLHSVGERVIKKMYRQFLTGEAISAQSYVAPRTGLPKVVICDLDGTLALLNGRNPYDASECENDLLNQPVHDVLHSLIRNDGRKVIFVSGRKEQYRESTVVWLHKVLNSDILDDIICIHMRADNDNRQDAIIKKEIFFEHIFNRYEVTMVLDDRDQVVDMWRNDIGLTVLQVAEGDF